MSAALHVLVSLQIPYAYRSASPNASAVAKRVGSAQADTNACFQEK